MHTHIIPKEMPNFSKKYGYGDFINLIHHREGFAKMMKGEEFFREIKSNCWDAVERIEEYKSNKTHVQVVCTIPVLFAYWAKPTHGAEVAKFLNDDLAQTVHDNPKTYIGLGTLPMQDTELSVKELERCKEIGLVGVQIGSNINDLNLNEPRFFPIFEACQELGMALFVHPWNMMGFHEIRKYWLPWLVSMPAETTRAICSMIFGGVLERLPNLRVNFAHAGGSFPATIGRIEKGFNCRPDLVAIDNDVNPRNYLGKFWVDSITHDPVMLRYVMDLLGEDKVTLGSDYPFPLGDLTIGKFIEEMELPTETIEKLFYQNTLEWLDLEAEKYILQ